MLPLLIVAAGLMAYGKISQGKAQEEVGNMNARIRQKQANDALASARFEEQRQKVMAAKSLGSIKAGYAASGLSMDGSALDVLEQSARTADFDSSMILKKGQNAAITYRDQGDMERYQGQKAAEAGYFGAAGSVMSGVSGGGGAGAG